MNSTLKKLLSLHLCVLAVNCAVSQALKVISESNAPLPFATIANLSRQLVFSADEQGIAILHAYHGDTLSISYVGYHPANFRFDSNQLTVITLKPLQNSLPSVVVTACKHPKEWVQKNYESREDERKFGGVAWTKAPSAAKVAIYVQTEKRNAILKQFSFWIEKIPGAPKSAGKSPLLISFYTVSEADSLPGIPLLSTPIIYYPGGYGKQTLKLDTVNLTIPSNGIYFCFQYVMNEKYEWKQIVKYSTPTSPELRDTVYTCYGGRIDGVYATNSFLAFWDVINDRWRSPAAKPFDRTRERGTIRYEARITSCESN